MNKVDSNKVAELEILWLKFIQASCRSYQNTGELGITALDLQAKPPLFPPQLQN